MLVILALSIHVRLNQAFPRINEHSKLLPNYGVFFEAMGELRHNLDTYDIVLKLKMPKVKDLEVKYLPYLQCKTTDTRFDSMMLKVCQEHNMLLDNFNADIEDFNKHLGRNIIASLYDILPKITGQVFLEAPDSERILHSLEDQVQADSPIEEPPGYPRHAPLYPKEMSPVYPEGTIRKTRARRGEWSPPTALPQEPLPETNMTLQDLWDSFNENIKRSRSKRAVTWEDPPYSDYAHTTWKRWFNEQNPYVNRKRSAASLQYRTPMSPFQKIMYLIWSARMDVVKSFHQKKDYSIQEAYNNTMARLKWLRSVDARIIRSMFTRTPDRPTHPIFTDHNKTTTTPPRPTYEFLHGRLRRHKSNHSHTPLDKHTNLTKPAYNHTKSPSRQQTQTTPNPPQLLNTTRSHRHKRGIDWTDIAVALGPIGTPIGVYYKEKKLKKAIKKVGREVIANRRGIIHLKDSLVAVGEKTAEAITELHNYTDRINERLQQHSLDLQDVFGQLLDIKHAQDYLIKTTHSTSLVMDFLVKSTARMIFDQQQTHRALDKFITGLDDLSSGYLSHHLVSPLDLKQYLSEIADNLQAYHPQYEVLFLDEHHYYNTPNIQLGFSNDELLIIIPVYIHREQQQPMPLFRIKTTPVPASNTTSGDILYTQLQPKYEYLAVGQTSFMTLDQADLDLCQNHLQQFFCQNLLMVQIGKERRCEAALFYEIADADIPTLCNSVVLRGIKPKPVVFDAGDRILIAHAPPPWQIIYDETDKLPQRMSSAPYTVIKRSQLCKKSLQLGHYFVPGTLDRCENDDVKLYYTINTVYRQALNRKVYNLSTHKIDELMADPPEVILPAIPLAEEIPVPGISRESEMDLNDLVHQLESSQEVAFSESSLSSIRTLFDDWGHKTSTVAAASLGSGLGALALGAFVFYRHHSLRNTVFGLLASGKVPTAQAAGHPHEQTLTYATLYTLVVIVALLLLAFGIYYLYVKSRIKFQLPTTICLVLRSDHCRNTIHLQDVDAIPLDVWYNGELKTYDLTLDTHCTVDYLFINWKGCRIYDNGQHVKMENYVPINILKRQTVRKMFTEGLVDVKLVMVYHGYLYKMNTEKDIQTNYLEKVSIAPYSGTSMMPDKKERDSITSLLHEVEV